MAVSDRELIDFVYAEARMLDELRFEGLDLYTEDGHYWMPLARTPNRRQAAPARRSSCCCQQPATTAATMLHSHRIPRRPKAYVVRTAFHYVETRQDAQTLYAGWAARITWSNRTARCASA